MQDLVGYKLLLAADNTEIMTWGGIWGQCPAVPNPLDLPNGDQVHAASPDSTYGDYILVSWIMDQPEPTHTQVNEERERRIGMVTSITIGGSLMNVDMSDQSRQNINGLSTLAIIALMNNVTTPIVNFRDADNIDHALTAAQVISMGQQVAARIDSVYKKSWAIKALTPIPVDYTNDSYW